MMMMMLMRMMMMRIIMMLMRMMMIMMMVMRISRGAERCSEVWAKEECEASSEECTQQRW